MSLLVRLDPAVLTAVPGEEVEATVLVANPGATKGTWRLEIGGDAAQWATVEPPEVVLPPGARAECRLRVRPLESVANGTGSVTLSVTARGATGEAVVAEGVVEVAAEPALGLRVEPKSSRSTLAATHRVIVDNRATSPARVVLSAHPPADADVDVVPDSLVVEARSTASARVVVRPRRRLLRGPGRQHRFSVRAEPLVGAPLSAGATMVQRPLTTGLLPALVMALAAVVLAGFGLTRVVGDGDANRPSGGGEARPADNRGVPVDDPAAPGDAASAPEQLPPPAEADVSATTTAPDPPVVTTVPPVPTDQRRIAFQSLRDGNSEIYATAADGSGLVTVSNSPSHDSEPAWSPDGHLVAFDSDRGGTGFDVWVMNADGSGATRLTSEPAADGYPTWSPDGTKIAFVTLRDGNSEIYVMNADGTGQRRLTTNLADDSRPTWSPDGSRIAFHTNRDGNFEVYSMNASDGTALANLTRHPASDLNPAWGPDGTRIAFDSTRDGPNAELYVMAADGGAPTRLTTHPAKDFWPTWSRDGSAIAFQSGRDGDQEVYVLRLGRGALARLTASPGLDGEPSW